MLIQWTSILNRRLFAFQVQKAQINSFCHSFGMNGPKKIYSFQCKGENEGEKLLKTKTATINNKLSLENMTG